jgi:hypothetical protein
LSNADLLRPSIEGKFPGRAGMRCKTAMLRSLAITITQPLGNNYIAKATRKSRKYLTWAAIELVRSTRTRQRLRCHERLEGAS